MIRETNVGKLILEVVRDNGPTDKHQLYVSLFGVSGMDESYYDFVLGTLIRSGYLREDDNTISCEEDDL